MKWKGIILFKVVILDDEEMIRYGLNIILGKQKDKYRVVGEAGDGEEGLKLIKALNPDLVITDIRMPKLNGLEILKSIYHLNIPCKVIMLTAHADFEYARTAVKYGADSYILKPINEEELFLELERLTADISEKAVKADPEEEIAKNLMEEVFSENRNLHLIVYKSLRYIFKNYKKNISLHDAAGELGVSPAYISKLFSENMGISFVSFLNRFKVNIAKKLLIKKSYKIHEISERLGFSNPKYFCKVFSDITQFSPSEYANIYGNYNSKDLTV